MIDNAQALLLPITIFVLLVVYILIRKLLKSKKNADEESNLEDEKYKTDWKYVKHTTKGKFYLLIGNIVSFLVVLFLAVFFLNKIFPEVQVFKDILSIYNLETKDQTKRDLDADILIQELNKNINNNEWVDGIIKGQLKLELDQIDQIVSINYCSFKDDGIFSPNNIEKLLKMTQETTLNKIDCFFYMGENEQSQNVIIQTLVTKNELLKIIGNLHDQKSSN